MGGENLPRQLTVPPLNPDVSPISPSIPAAGFPWLPSQSSPNAYTLSFPPSSASCRGSQCLWESVLEDSLGLSVGEAVEYYSPLQENWNILYYHSPRDPKGPVVGSLQGTCISAHCGQAGPF